MIHIANLRGDFILSACLRYDLSPIPVTFEADIRITPEIALDFRDGKTIRVNEIDFRIMKALPLKNAGGQVQGQFAMSATRITAFPVGCVDVSKPRRTAVIVENTSFATIYRSCGATVSIGGDFIVPRFTCFKGVIPTFQIAQILQEEASVLSWRANKVHVLRLRDVFAQTPVDSIAIEASEDVESAFLEHDEIPVYLSTDENGKFLQGRRIDESQTVTYVPRKRQRELDAMSRVLVRRKIIKASPNLSIRAGDVIDLRGTPLAVMTAAHVMKNNTDGDGAEQYSRFWLGALS